jgi:GNAT superfamily N-acetyltransferase
LGADDALIDAAVAAQTSWICAVARVTGGRIWREDGLLAAEHHGELLIPFPAGFDGLDSILDRARANGIRMVSVWGRDEDAPAPPDFDEGWQPHWMAGTAEGPPDPRVEETRDVPEYDDYGQALLQSVPGKHVVARVDGQFAGMAWAHERMLFDVFVPAQFRRQGIGKAITQAAAAGEPMVLNATGEGELLYRALGFRSLGYGRTWWRRISHSSAVPNSS